MTRRIRGGPEDEGPLLAEHLADVVPLVTDAPAAPPVPGPGYRLPAFLTRLVGRTTEIDELTARLGSARLVTLTGAGGIGKTRLAVAVADRIAHGPALFVDLTSLRDPSLLDEELASALGLGELRDRDLADGVAEARGSRTLLLLDNCEHLVEACSRLVPRLLESWSGLQVLATSRQGLGVPGEVVWRVPSLEVPPGVVEPEEALRASAVRLFCERAAAVEPRFMPSPATLGPIVEICRRLDGNPLAIELAAVRVGSLAPADIAARLGDRFSLLRATTAAGPARHRALSTTLEWSHDLLSGAERMLLRRLSVFSGEFGLEAAEQVCAGSDVHREQVVDLLGGLVTKSLVVADTRGTTARYWLLETVRHYAADALAAAGEAAEVGERHARWCLGHRDESGPDNVRTALGWCIAEGQAELALRLAALQIWQSNGRFAEGRDWVTRVLTASEGAPAGLRAGAWHDLAVLAILLGDFEEARAHASRSLDLWAEAGDGAGAARTQGLMGAISSFDGSPEGVECLERDLEAVRSAGDGARAAEVLASCGYARLIRGELVAAHRHFEELVPLARRNGNDPLTANGLVGAGAAALGRGDYGSAESRLREGLELAISTAQDHNRVIAKLWLAELARVRGETDGAAAQFEECLGESRDLSAPDPLVKALVGLGRVLLARGETDAGGALFEEAAEVARAGAQRQMVTAALAGLGEVAAAHGDATSARSHFEDALTVARQFGDRRGVARATFHLAVLARGRGALADATSLHDEALTQFHEVGDRPGVADSLEALAGLWVAKERWEAAARLFGASQALRDVLGCARLDHPGDTYEADLALLAEQLAPEERETAWTQGAALTSGEAVAYAMRGRGVRERPGRGSDLLTPAERDVAGLVSERLTSAEVAERLFISRRTVESHLHRVYKKLGVNSRRQLRQVLADG